MSSFCRLSGSKPDFSLVKSMFNNVLVMSYHLLPTFVNSTTDVGYTNSFLLIVTYTVQQMFCFMSNKKAIFCFLHPSGRKQVLGTMLSTLTEEFQRKTKKTAPFVRVKNFGQKK